MKKRKILATLLALAAFVTSAAQDITGQWNGALSLQGMQLRVILNITKTDTGYKATMDSPDQGAKGIPVTSTTFKNPRLKLEVANARIEYSGELKDSVIIGTFKQGGREFPLNLSRTATGKTAANRPQEPQAPYPYLSENITFPNTKANVTLAGTLTLPKTAGPYPVAILITGSGPQNRDEEILGHKPFLVIADHLTRNGIAVLRYDDRGVGQSTGNFSQATSVDFATDAESAIAYLKTRKEIKQNKIGLIGHSEGGIIAPMIAARSKDVAFIVLLAGSGLPGDQLLLLQQDAIAKASGAKNATFEKSRKINADIYKMIVKTKDSSKLRKEITSYFQTAIKNNPGMIPSGISQEQFINAQVSQATSPWVTYFLRYNPATDLQKVKCPVLAVNGSKDVQVPSKENLAAIQKALQKGGNINAITKEFLNLNHLFQESSTGLPNEYATIAQTFSPIVLDYMTRWIVQQVK